MKTSNKGLLEIAEHEGIVPAPYFDSVGVLTYGIGHTKSAGGIDPATMDRAMPADIEAAIDHALDVFRDDVGKYESRVNSAIKVPLSQYQFDALVSFDFNTGGIHRAKLTRRINAGDAGAEMRLFKAGDYDANGDQVFIWGTDGKGNITSCLRSMSGADILKRMGRTSKPATKTHWFATLLKSFFGGTK